MALRGLCLVHGGGKKCTFPDCQAKAIKYGKCIRHGGRRLCIVQDCDRAIYYRGLCARHEEYPLCNVDGCSQKSFSNKLQCSEHLNNSVPVISILYQQPIQMQMSSILNPWKMTSPTKKSISYQQTFQRTMIVDHSYCFSRSLFNNHKNDIK